VDNEKGKAVEALPFIEWCQAGRMRWSGGGSQINCPAAPISGISTSLQQATGY